MRLSFRLLFLGVVIFPLAVGEIIASPIALAQATVSQTEGDDPLDIRLEVEGILEEGDLTLNDGSFYDQYTFEGRAGETISITLESLEFDTYLHLLNEQGEQLAENDDIEPEIVSNTQNSWITLTLPADGQYRVWANAYDEALGHGQYSLTVVAGQTEPILSKAVLRQVDANYLLEQGIQQFRVSQFREALVSWQAALDIYREIGDRVGEGVAMGNLGNAYLKLSQYQQAIDLYEQVLTIARETGSRAGESTTLGNLGLIYDNLGRYQQAIDFYEQTLTIAREIGDRAGEGRAIGSLGTVYSQLEQYQQAINFYEQRLVIAREIDDRIGEGITLGNLGNVYLNLGKHQRAIDLYEQSLTIAREIGDRAGEGRALGNLGLVYDNLGQYQQAIDLFEQGLSIAQETGNRAGERIILNNLGFLFQTTDQPELAIVFYKQSVNTTEEIRQDIADPEFLKSYTDKVSDTYRRLADLLLEQGRILEAQQVLELLKVQELQDYTDDERSSEQLAHTIPTPEGCDLNVPLLKVSLLPIECELIETYTTLVEFGQQFRDCETAGCSNLADYRRQRDDLFREYRVAVEDLEDFIRDRLTNDDALLKPTLFASKAQEIIRQQPGTVIIYPLVLDDKLWLLFASDGRVTSKREVDIDQLTLGQEVVKFRELLEDRYSDIDELQATAKKLYDWLIAPIETELANEDIQHLVFSLDRTTRYIPMAALYDGSQYLVEKYTVTTILSAALTDVTERTPIGTENVPVLGAGVSQSAAGFPALPNVPIELDGIIQETDQADDTAGVYAGRQLLDEKFTFEALQDALAPNGIGARMLHIATHGEFVPSNRDASYLLMGNGAKLPIAEIDTLGTYLEGIHLAVLSACQTALGGPDEEGLEIAGLGYYFLKNQVDAVMASLWNVNDSSTSQLMQLFYENLSAGTEANPVTKAEALQAAQLDLLRSNEPGNSDPDRFTLISRDPANQPRPDIGLAHPYYWAPFTLIGNGL